MIEFLINVVESQFYNYLSKLRICLAFRNCLRVPDDIVNLGWVSLFIWVFSHITKTQRNPDSCFRAIKLGSLSSRYWFLFKSINNIMLSHIDKYFLTMLILSLYYKSCLWLNHGASLRINNRLSRRIQVLILVSL